MCIHSQVCVQFFTLTMGVLVLNGGGSIGTGLYVADCMLHPLNVVTVLLLCCALYFIY